ncbi:MAG TPA: SPOR domain-containing protein [Sphingomonas sp.]|nr:SPOR domain-containing protein [Sphingomonas sp.]
MLRKPFLLRYAVGSAVLLSAAGNAAAITDAVKSATRAEKALAKDQPAKAVADAEAAVAAEPGNANYRMLLGRAYLESGRFQSAAASFADVLALDPSRGGAALSLALARLGLGDRDGARAVLEAHGGAIPPSDRGLALALAGDPAAGVALLEEVVRNGGADAKARQNLALSYALAGRWPEAKLMASYDLDPQAASRRILEWSRFALDGQAPAQVAALLGVQPGEDPGRPLALALNAPASAPVQVAQAAPPPPPVAMAAAPVALAVAVAETAPVAKPQSGIQFASRSEVAQAIASPRPVIVPQPVRPVRVQPVAASPRPNVAAQPMQPARLQPAAFVQPLGGRFVVQLGAFSSQGAAEGAWSQAVARVDALASMTPSAATFAKDGRTLYRLSVGGFATRVGAAAFCERLRARGGQCFVRESAGDAPLQWAKRPGGNTRLAAR